MSFNIVPLFTLPAVVQNENGKVFWRPVQWEPFLTEQGSEYFWRQIRNCKLCVCECVRVCVCAFVHVYLYVHVCKSVLVKEREVEFESVPSRFEKWIKVRQCEKATESMRELRWLLYIYRERERERERVAARDRRERQRMWEKCVCVCVRVCVRVRGVCVCVWVCLGVWGVWVCKKAWTGPFVGATISYWKSFRFKKSSFFGFFHRRQKTFRCFEMFSLEVRKHLWPI